MIVDEGLALDRSLPPMAKALFLLLKAYDAHRIDGPSRRRLAWELNTSPATIKRAIGDLERSGWLRVDRRTGSTNRYEIAR